MRRPGLRQWVPLCAAGLALGSAGAGDDLASYAQIRRIYLEPQQPRNASLKQLLERPWREESWQARTADLGLTLRARVGTPAQELPLRLELGQGRSWIMAGVRGVHGPGSPRGVFQWGSSSTLSFSRTVPGTSLQTVKRQGHVLADERRYRGIWLEGNNMQDLVRLQRCALNLTFLLVDEAPSGLLQLRGGGGTAADWQGALGLWPANASLPTADAVVLIPLGDPLRYGHYELLLGSVPLRGVLPGPPVSWRWAPMDAAGRAPASLRGHYSSGEHVRTSVVVDTTTTFLLVPPRLVPEVLEMLLPRPVWYLCKEERPAQLIYCDCETARRFMAPLHLELHAEPLAVGLLLTASDLLEPLPASGGGWASRCLLRLAAGARQDAVVLGELLLKRYAIAWDLAGRRLGIAPAFASERGGEAGNTSAS